MNTEQIEAIEKAAEAAIAADEALTNSGSGDWSGLTVKAMNATRAMKDELSPATVLELCRLAKEREWIPVSERLPTNDTYDIFDVLVVIKAGTLTYVSATSFDQDDHGFMLNDDRAEVTHWMPLPEPPK